MLTTKQQRFVEEYLIDANGAAAAVRAGFSDRYPDRQAHTLLKNSEIAAAVDAAKEQRSLEVGIDSRWVLNSLVEEATADLSQLFNPATGDLRPVHEWPMIWRTGLVQGLEIEVLFDGHGKDRKQIGIVKKIKLDSRIRRKELIGKHVHVNAFQENVQHNGLDGLGDRLERAARRADLEEAALKRDAISAPSIEIMPPTDTLGAVEPKLADEADTDAAPALETRQKPVSLSVEGYAVATHYGPLWPQRQAFADE